MRAGTTLRQVADSALEATVFFSWTRLGIAARRRLWSWPPDPVPAGSMDGAQVVVTGGTGGIGQATASLLAAAGATVGIVGRDPDRAREAAGQLGRAPGGRPDAVWWDTADLGSVAAVSALAGRVEARTDRLSALVHAAGAMHHSYATSPEGTERTVAEHVVGSHLLTGRLAPLLGAGAPSVVVWISSGGMYLQRLDVEHLELGPQEFSGSVAYERAKRAQVSLARLWGERLVPAGVAAVAMHPGWVDTRALRDGLPRFAATLAPLLRSPDEGADTAAWLAGGAAGPRPRPALWLDRRPRREHRRPAPAEEARLWAWCEGKAA